MKTKRLLSLCVLGLVLTTFVAAVSAAEFYGIVDSFGKKPRNAYLDVSVDTTVSSGPVDVSFNVYNAQGGQVGLFSLTTNGNGFGIFSNPHLAPNAIWKVNLTQNEALSNLIVHASGPVIMQAVIDDGQTIQSFMVLPAQ